MTRRENFQRAPFLVFNRRAEISPTLFRKKISPASHKLALVKSLDCATKRFDSSSHRSPFFFSS